MLVKLSDLYFNTDSIIKAECFYEDERNKFYTITLAEGQKINVNQHQLNKLLNAVCVSDLDAEDE